MISIIMLSHNAAKYIKHAVKTLKSADGAYPYELIVLDNAIWLKYSYPLGIAT